MPDNIISEEEFLALPTGVEEEKDENIISEEEFLALPGKSIDPAIADPIVGSENTASNGVESSTDTQKAQEDILEQRLKQRKIDNDAYDGFDEVIPYETSEEGGRIYYGEEEVGYDYDRSKGIRFKKDTYGEYLDNLAYKIIAPFVNTTVESIESGQEGEYTDEMLDIIERGSTGDMTIEEATKTIEIMQRQSQKAPSKEILKWSKTMEEESNPVYGFFKATAQNPIAAYEAIISSVAGQVKAMKSGELVAAATTVGAGTAAVGSIAGPIGTTASFIRGFMSTMGGGIETASKFGDLIMKEFADEENPDGRIPTEQELIAFVQDEEKFNSFRNKALLKGATIAAVDNFGGGIVSKSVAKTAKTGRKILATTKGLVGETVVGGGGEALSSAVIGEEISATDVGLEILGQGGQATVDIGSALITPGSFKVNGEKASLKQVNKILETATTEELAKIDIEVKNNAALDAEVKNKQNDAVLETQVNERVEDPTDRKEMVDLEKKRVKAEADTKKKGIQAVPGAIETLESIEIQMNEIVGKYTAIDGRTKDVRARKKTAKQVKENIADKNFETNLEFAKKHSKLYGLEVEDNLTQDQIKEKYGEELANSLGGVVDNKLVINKKLAKTRVYGDNVANHELLHGIIKASGQKIKQSTINNFLNLIGEKNTAVIQKRIDDSNYDAKYMADTPDEYFTIFSDAIANGEIQFNDNIFTKVKDVIRRTFADLGYAKVDFESARGAYNFLKDYNKSIHKGALASGVVKATKGEGRVETPRFSKEASDKVQSIYEEQGEAGAFEIIEQFKPIVSRITEKRREAPNFDRELLMSEIEIGERGILDLISKYDPDSGVPLAAYINKFLPSRAIEASRRVLGEEFTEDVSERVDIAAEEVADVDVKAKPKKKRIVLADRLGVTDKVSKAINKIVPSLELDKLTFKTLKNKVPEITGELFGISPKKIVSGANITKGELQAAQMFISKNSDVLLAMLPDGATASGTATGVPNTLLKPFYTKTSRAKMAKTGTKAGLAVQVKNDNISKNDFLEVFGIVDGIPNRTDRNTSARVLALANQTGKMITNQAVRQEVGEATARAKETINRLKDGKSKIMFSKDNFKDIYENKVGALSNALGYKLSPKKTAYRINSKGKRVPYQTRDLDIKFNDKETYRDAGVRVVNTFLDSHPQFRELIKITMTGGEQAGFFQTVPNFNKLINKTDVEQRYIGRTKYGGKGGVYDINHYNKLKKGELNKDNNERLPLLLEFYEAIGAHLQSFPDDIVIFEEMLLDTGKQQNVFTRILAPFAFYPINTKTGKPIFDQKIAEEHTDPQNLIGKAMLSGAFFGNLDQVWKVVGKSYMQGAILNSAQNPHDKTINSAGYQSSMPDVYYEKIVPRLISGELNLPNGYSSIVRLAAAGIDLNMYYLTEADMSIAEFFKVDKIKDIKKQNELITQQLSGEITADYAENIAKVSFSKNIDNNKKLSNAIAFSRSANNPTKGITVLDFDDTLATSKSLIRFTKPDGTKGTLNAEQYASTYQELTDLGYKWDFSEFNKVVDGKTAPLFNKAMKLQGKFGPENMFVLTARPAEAAPAIFAFLQANGLNIPLKNITGLANSTAEAKALWMVDKVSDGYNDFYFADDALQNVQAVDNILEQFDVKRKVQQARIKFSKSMDENFNDILENVTGIESDKRFSIIKGRKRGESKGKFRVFVPPSHEDFVGLLYNFMGKGKEGNAHRDFLEQALVRPLNRANREYDTARQSIANDYKELNKQFPDVKKKLTKKTKDGDFTNEDAVRVYLWNKYGHKIPGLSPTDQTNLVELVEQDAGLKAYAETLSAISKQETYVNPTEGWNSGDIRMDLDDATGRIGRKQFFAEFNENADVIFSEENLNKIEAGYGKEVRESLEDILYRIQTGRNRPTGQNAQVNKLMNFLNGSVGTVMFFNMRSALLQQMSIVNYINFADNNVFAAAKAFANQKQYWADWSFIFNSDMLKQRRGGIQTDVNGAELAASLRNSKDITRKLISKLLELGFLPTQIGDNIAIATGGASYYRNRINTYLKQGLSQKEAEAKAFTDFQDITQATQQSARPDMVSKQQASVIGKVILNFQNVTSQFNRLGKKAFQDIYNRRITRPNTTQIQSDISNASRITYYFAVQNLIFYTLQTALFAMMFDDDEEDVNNLFLKKKERLINGSIDSVLRGTGLIGGIVATLKNVAIAFARQRDVKYNPDESAVIVEALNLSPVLGIKARQIVNAEKTLNYNKKVINEMETFDIDNPQWSAVTSYTQALTNLPLNRLYNKTQNVRQALNNDHSAWERSLMFLGWSQYNLDIENKKMEKIKEDVKGKKKNKKSRRFIR
jgi:hypothetical protein